MSTRRRPSDPPIANSLRHAMELALRHARERHNRSVDRVAELMGLGSRWVLYKWLESGKLPACQIPAFEHACGCNAVTRYIAHAAHYLVVPMPTGRDLTPADVNRLQAKCTAAVAALIECVGAGEEADTAIAAVTRAMEGLAAARANLEQLRTPALDFADTLDDEAAR